MPFVVLVLFELLFVLFRLDVFLLLAFAAPAALSALPLNDAFATPPFALRLREADPEA